MMQKEIVVGTLKSSSYSGISDPSMEIQYCSILMTRNNRLSQRTSSNLDPSQVGQVGRETETEIQTAFYRVKCNANPRTMRRTICIHPE